MEGRFLKEDYEMKKNSYKYKIAITYLAIGAYDVFWDEFYRSSERYLFPDCEKEYFLFTDSKKLLSLQLLNVTVYYHEDEGWVKNVIAKNECILQLKDKLHEHDFLFYINANVEIKDTILGKDILPKKENDFLSILSFDHYSDIDKKLYPYERNPNSEAYIPYDKGLYYFQSGFYGGRIKEILELASQCAQYAKIDMNNGIMAVWHDESYLNKYLLDRKPKIIGSSFFSLEENRIDSRAIFLDKRNILGVACLLRLKGAFIKTELRFMINEKFENQPLHIITSMGGLGNQMFQYAFFLELRNHLKNVSIYFSPQKEPAHYCSIEQVFSIGDKWILPEKIKQHIRQIPQTYIHTIKENQDFVFQKMENNWPLISIYSGYWQTEQYFKQIKPLIKEAFKFNTNQLNKRSKQIEKFIRSNISISIHIRRGDYLTKKNQAIYGNICTPDYYKDAISQIQARLYQEDLHYFIFSDDPEWVKKNIKLRNATIIDWNTGSDSWQDMYLMSICDHNIIANSTFSWWGAWLNEHENPIIIAPYRWLNTKFSPDILPKEWIKIYPPNYICNPYIENLESCDLSIFNDGLFFGKMGLIVFLFHYADYLQDTFYQNVAKYLFDDVISKLSIHTTFDYSDGILGIGAAIEYLLQEQFIYADSDNIFEDVDELVSQHCTNLDDFNFSLNHGISGWLRYLRFRVIGDIKRYSSPNSLNTASLNKILNYLNKNNQWNSCVDVIHELIELDNIGLLNSQWDKLHGICQRSKYLASKENIRCFSESFLGLRGASGKYLNELPIPSSRWDELI